MRPVGLLDLVDCSYQTIGRYPGAYTARYAGADAELVLIETQQVDDQRESYGLELVDRSGEVLRTLAEGMHPTEWRDPETAGAFTWQVAADGAAVVVGSPAGLMAHRLDTATTEDLDAPGHACLVSRGLADAALVSCVPERYPATCWEMWGGDGARGLWSVPLSGEAAVPVWVPDIEVPGEPDEACWIGAFIDMLPASATGPALLESTGCCECGGALALVEDGRATPVLPDGCSPRLVAQWHDAWVVVDQVVTGGWNMALMELDETGDLRRVLTPTMDAYGGVFHVLAAADR